MKNVEFKVRVADASNYEEKLRSLNPMYAGTDMQTDTYFYANKGRLKLREGNIENALIQYEREDIAEAKHSEIELYVHQPSGALKRILEDQLGVKVVVKKRRNIYFIDDVKFHFDEVEPLGQFVEVEVLDRNGTRSLEAMQATCQQYFHFFDFQPHQLVRESYSDMIIALQQQ